MAGQEARRGTGGGSSGGEGSIRRSQPRRHHSVTSDHLSASNSTRLAMDLEVGRLQSASTPASPSAAASPTAIFNGVGPDEKREAILKHLQRKFPEHAHAIGRQVASTPQTHLAAAQRNPALYQPPASVYDDDPGIMSEVETSATGFRRSCKARSSLPIVRTPSKTQERPLGLVFLQYRSETKRALLPNEITTLDTVKALFVRSFPRQLTMEYLDSRHIRLYIHDPSKDMFYELEDLRDIRDRSVIRIYEQDSNGASSTYNTWDQDMSYFSEPEFDSEYQNQHIHRTKGSKSSSGPVQPVQSSNYYGIVSPYSAGNRTGSLPHGVSLRPYSPAPPGPPEQRPKSQPVIPGAGPAPPKPQRSFQQAVVPLAGGGGGKGIRSTPAPTGPPPSIPSPRSAQPRTLDRRHDPQGAYRTTPERPFSAGPGYHTPPDRRYEPSYHSSPERRTQDSGYLSSPERRLDQQRSFPGYGSSYDDSYYGERVLYGSRSGSVTPIVDEEARIRVEFMERQLASLTGLVQKALQSEDNREAEVEAARQTFKERPAKPAIKSISRSSTSERDVRLSSGKPTPPPKPASLSGSSSEARHSSSSPSKELHLSPEMYCQLRKLRKQTKDLRLEVRNLRRMAQAQAVTARETVRDTCHKIKAMLAAVQGGEDHVCAERLRVSREEDLYRQDVMHLEKDLAELESQVEELRSNVINRRCRVNMSDVESMALVLSRASKTVADLKARFPSLQESLKAVMAAEMEVVVREEKFLKEEPERLENALRRCKKLTGTLVTLKRLASVQEQRHTGGGGHHPPEKSASADGPHSDGEAHSARTFDSNPHTVIHVPPDGHQRAPRTENALDALLDELQTFTKPSDIKRDVIPGLTTPQRRLPSYPSSDSPVRSAQSFAPPVHPKPVSGKLLVSEAGHKQSLNLSPSGSPVPEGKAAQDMCNRVSVGGGGGLKQTLINGPESLPNPGPPLPTKKVPPPPPPRTTSRSPLTSPTTSSGSLRDTMGHIHSRSFSEPGNKSITEEAVKRIMAAKSVSREEAEHVVKTIALSDDSRRDQLSSNSSSSESVNSQEGLQMALQHQQQHQQGGLVGNMAAKLEGKVGLDGQANTPPKSRQELLEHRHQELLRKQKQLQEQYARLQQLQRGQVRFSPPRSALGDLKKTGSESNILSKTALSLTPSSGSLTHLAMTGSPSSMTLNPKLLSSGSGSVTAGSGLAKPQQPSKIFETDIL